MGERRDSLEIVEAISTFLRRNEGLAIPPTQIAQGARLNYDSCKDYLELIHFVQELPKLKVIRKYKGALYVFEKDLTEYPEAKQKAILRDEFGVVPEDSDKLYVGLLESGPQKLPITKEVKEGLKYKHLVKAKDGKIYLTPVGEAIARGAKRLFS